MGQDQFAKKPGIKNAIYKREIFVFYKVEEVAGQPRPLIAALCTRPRPACS